MISQIKDFDGYYVDTEGQVYSTRKNGGYHRNMTPLQLRKDKDGYFEVGLYRNKKRYFRRVHRLVAEAFVPNPEHLPQINHIDGNKQNNHVSNLEWCTCSENMLHAFRVLNKKPNITTNIPIRVTNKQNGTELYFNSIKDCAYYLHMSHEHLGRILAGKCDITKWRKGKQYKVEYCNM